MEDHSHLDHQDLPHALAELASIRRSLDQHPLVFFLDFDGTLAPIVAEPEAAEIAQEARQALVLLARVFPVCVVSGRSFDSLRKKVDLDAIYYAADHGHRIVGPSASGVDFEIGPDDVGELRAATRRIQEALCETDGVLLEHKEVSLAVHYRGVAPQERGAVRDAVHKALEESHGLRLMEGKMVYELLPDIAWGKGEAVRWLLEHLQSARGADRVPICVGDDITDEDMFLTIKGRGLSVVVGDLMRTTHADYRLDDVVQVARFLKTFAEPRTGSAKDVV